LQIAAPRVSHQPVNEPKSNLQFKRVVVKLSGEALASRESGAAIDTNTLSETAAELAEVRESGIQVAVVVGGGNIFRGLRGASEGMDRAQSDYMGMLATVINSPWGANPRDDRHRNSPSGRTLHSATGDSTSGPGPRRDLRRWYRQPVFFHGHRGCVARHGDPSRGLV